MKSMEALQILEEKEAKRLEVRVFKPIALETGMSDEVLIQWMSWYIANAVTYEDFLVGAELGMSPVEFWTVCNTGGTDQD